MVPTWQRIKYWEGHPCNMKRVDFLPFYLGLLALVCVSSVNAEDLYRNFKWVFTYGTVSPLGVPQRGILINGMFPGPIIYCETNDNVVVEVVNRLDEPFLITWNGVKQRKTSWQDGVLGTNCPIPPNSAWTYQMQVKDRLVPSHTSLHSECIKLLGVMVGSILEQGPSFLSRILNRLLNSPYL